MAQRSTSAFALRLATVLCTSPTITLRPAPNTQLIFISLNTTVTVPGELPAHLSRCRDFDVHARVRPESVGACVTVLYEPRTPWTDAVMGGVAAHTGLQLGKDIVGVGSAEEASQWLFDNLFSPLDFMVTFNATIGLESATVAPEPGSAAYQLWFNGSATQAWSKNNLGHESSALQGLGYDLRLMGLQEALDASLVGFVKAGGVPFSNESVPDSFEPADLQFEAAGLPSQGTAGGSALSPEGNGFVFVGGSMLLELGACMVMILATNLVASEKHRKLLGALRSIGLYESAFWVSWVLVLCVMTMFTSLITLGIGYWTGLYFFTHVDFAVHFISFWCLCMSMVGMALWLASFVRQTLWVNLGSFLLVALTLSLQTIATLFNAYQYFFSPQMPTVLAVLLYPFASVHYGYIMHDIILWVTPHYTSTNFGPAGTTQNPSSSSRDRRELMATGIMDHPAMSFAASRQLQEMLGMGPGLDEHTYADVLGAGTGSSDGAEESHLVQERYTWGNFTGPGDLVKVYTPTGVYNAELPSTSYAAGVMLLIALIGFIFAWYLAQVASGDDLGAKQPFYFFFLPSYWGWRGAPEQPEDGDTIMHAKQRSSQGMSVVLHKLTKSYKEATAVKELSITFPTGQITALLGHNGSGKTTTVSCIAGLTAPTHGEVFVCGESVREDPAAIRDLIGVCPQHDYLYSELTAYEHMLLFCRFKGVPRAATHTHIMQRLRLVGLDAVAHSFTQTFSGGMKRRLSVALATTGFARVLLLDEVTTGLDPLSRRRVWQFIGQLKSQRVVVLTTHDLTEADALGDQVAIMSNGRLRALGSSLFLKSRFGAGFQVNLNVVPDHASVAQIKQAVADMLPGARVLLAGTTKDEFEADTAAIQGLAKADAASGTADADAPASTFKGEDELPQFVSGSLTISIPKALVKRIPGFLRLLNEWTLPKGSAGTVGDVRGKQCVKDWGISRSTLEEVFLKLGAQHQGVNQRDGDTVAAESALESAVTDSVREHAGEAAGASMVLEGGKIISRFGVLMHSKGVQAPDDAEAVDVVLDALEDMVQGEAASGDAQEGAVPATDAEAEESGSESKAGAAAAAPAMAAAPETPPLPAPEPHQAASLPAVEGAGELPSQPKRAGGRVSLVGQTFAVCLLRLRLQSKLIRMNVAFHCCLLLAVLVSVLVSVLNVTAPPNCLYNDIAFTSGSCTPDEFLAALGEAVEGNLPPSHSDVALGASGSSSSSAFVGGGSATYHPLYRSLCVSNFSTQYTSWQPQDCDAEGALLVPDWSLPQAVAMQSNNSQQRVYGGRNVWYADASDGGVPFAQYSKVLSPELDEQLTYFAKWWNLADLPPFLSTPSNPLSPSSRVLAAQEYIRAHRIVDDSYCFHYGPVLHLSRANATAFTLANVPDYSFGLTKSQPWHDTPALHARVDLWITSGSRGNQLYPYEPLEDIVFRESPTRSYCTSNIFYGSSVSSAALARESQYESPYFAPFTSINGLSNALLRTSLNASAVRQVQEEDTFRSLSDTSTSSSQPVPVPSTRPRPQGPYILTGVGAMGRFSFASASGNTQQGPQLYLWPLITMVFLPYFAQTIASEKLEKQYLMMRLAGLLPGGYWLGSYIFAVLVQLYFSSVFVIIAYAAKAAFFTQVDPGYTVGVLLSWALAQPGYAYLLASASRSPLLATALGYLLVIVATVVAATYPGEWPQGLNWIPVLSYTRLSILMLRYGGSAYIGSEQLGIIFINLGEGLLALALGMYLHTILPSSAEATGVVSDPCFCISMAARALGRGKRRQLPGSAAPAQQGAAAPSESTLLRSAARRAAGADVIAEEEVVTSGRATPASHPVVIQGLVKEFPSNAVADSGTRPVKGAWAETLAKLRLGSTGVKSAVDGVTFAVEKGAVFGLLGPNGAGKSTTLTIATGHMLPTSGDAFIGGYSVEDDVEYVYRQLGVVPQFDVVFDSLSVREHLDFYARLKGIQANHLRGAVQRVAEAVELDGDPLNMAAKTLSGGMRRRLSIAIALIGDPAVLVCDEPTTGLDSGTKRSIWNILQAQRAAGRTQIITSHSMEEIETLVDGKIAIMFSGRVQTVGTQAQLKQRWGEGIKLTLTLTDESESTRRKAEAFVRSCLNPRARLLNAVGSSVAFMLPLSGVSEEVDVPTMFEKLQQAKSEDDAQAKCIVEFGLAAQSLEEIFVRVIEAAEDAELAK